jgi:transcription initiation factor TFIIIB Brf1 subunit/transcription initiation factor TFIIB
MSPLIAARKSLAGWRCPYCRRFGLVFDWESGDNVCPSCHGVVVTEEEFLSRARDGRIKNEEEP